MTAIEVALSMKNNKENFTLLLSPEDEDLAVKKFYIQRSGTCPTAFYLEEGVSHTVTATIADRIFGHFDRNRYVTRAVNNNRLDCRRENICIIPRGMRPGRELETGLYEVQRKNKTSYCVCFREEGESKRKSKHFKTLEEARAFRREKYLAANPLQLLQETRETPEILHAE